MSVVVAKLGVGNTASVIFALERLGAEARIVDDPRDIADAERLILPGVGSAAYAVERLELTGLGPAIRAFPRPILGICLGLQLLFESSAEGEARCLGLIPGRVERLASDCTRTIPHMGWSRLLDLRAHPLTEGVREGDYAYFVHSFAAAPGSDAIATASYGAAFTAIAARGNAMGCQFHPERSGAVGARILKNFLALPC